MNSKISQEVIVKDLKHSGALVAARYIDKKHRIRLLTGEHNGEVLHKHNYEVVEKLEHYESPMSILGAVWSMD